MTDIQEKKEEYERKLNVLIRDTNTCKDATKTIEFGYEYIQFCKGFYYIDNFITVVINKCDEFINMTYATTDLIDVCNRIKLLLTNPGMVKCSEENCDNDDIYNDLICSKCLIKPLKTEISKYLIPDISNIVCNYYNINKKYELFSNKLEFLINKGNWLVLEYIIKKYNEPNLHKIVLNKAIYSNNIKLLEIALKYCDNKSIDLQMMDNAESKPKLFIRILKKKYPTYSVKLM